MRCGEEERFIDGIPFQKVSKRWTFFLSFFFLFLFLSHSVQLYEKVKMTKTLEKLTRLTNCILFVAPKMSAERERERGRMSEKEKERNRNFEEYITPVSTGSDQRITSIYDIFLPLHLSLSFLSFFGSLSFFLSPLFPNR